MSRDRTIWVVDDEPGLAETIASLLNAGGWRARSFEDGREALAECLLGSPPRVLVTDLTMPHLDGVALARELHVRLDGRRPRLVAISGALEALEPEAARLFDGRLDKPFCYEELVDALSGAPRVRRSGLRIRAIRDRSVEREGTG